MGRRSVGTKLKVYVSIFCLFAKLCCHKKNQLLKPRLLQLTKISKSNKQRQILKLRTAFHLFTRQQHSPLVDEVPNNGVISGPQIQNYFHLQTNLGIMLDDDNLEVYNCCNLLINLARPETHLSCLYERTSRALSA